MNTTSIDTSGWNQIALTISNLLKDDPVQGIFTIFLSVIVFLILIIVAVWALTRIIKANKSLPEPVGEIFNREQFTKNILSVIEEITNIQLEGRELSEKHTRYLEYTILRDQMTLVDSSISNIKSIISVAFIHLIKLHSSHTSYNIMDFPAISIFENAMKYSFEEITKLIKRAAKEDGLAEKDEREFSKYSERKVIMLQNHFNQIFESVYISKSFPIIFAQEVIEEKSKEVYKEFKHILESIRDISIHYKTIIKREEDAYQKRWREFNSNILNRLSKDIVK